MSAALAVGGDARAMTIHTFDEATLREKADVIVEGEVVRLEVRRIGQRIISFYLVHVDQLGQSTPRLEWVAVPGGDVDGFSQRVPGAPQLKVGARYRFFLGAKDGPALDGVGPGSRGIFGFYQGVFLLADDGAAVPFDHEGHPVKAL